MDAIKMQWSLMHNPSLSARLTGTRSDAAVSD
jgi:hypothetical protein